MKATPKHYKVIVGQKAFDKVAFHLVHLYDRWQDEKEYEDFKDYKESFSKVTGLKIVKMTSRPFKVIFLFKGNKYYMHLTSRSFDYGGFKSNTY